MLRWQPYSFGFRTTTTPQPLTTLMVIQHHSAIKAATFRVKTQGDLRINLCHGGRKAKKLTRPSSRYGMRHWRPWLLAMRSSRPRFRSAMRPSSKHNSRSRADHPPLCFSVVLCRIYPPSCSSAPMPDSTT